MAMFISKFHKLIESKVFWYGIIGVMIVTMTLSLVPNVHDYGSFIKGFMVHNAGKLNGREVTVKEYTQATQLARRSGLFDRDDVNSKWEWLAVQDKAEELGIAAGKEDLAKVVYDEVTRQTGGQWDDSLFGRYLSMYAEQNDIPSHQLQLAAEMIRQNISLQRTLGAYAGGVLVTPQEMRRVFSDFFDTFDVEMATLPKPAASTNETAVTGEQIAAHYEQNKDSYKTPPQRRAVFTRINIAALTDTNRVTEAAAREYYDRNLSQYLLRSTNAVDVLTATNSYVAFSDARAGILFKLAYEEAAQAAQSDASRLYERLLPVNGKPPRDPSGEVVTLEKVAGSFGLQIETSEWVSANAFIPGVELGRQFTKALFDLDPAVSGEVTEPLIASNSVYLAKLLDFRPERVPELAEIKDRVAGDVRRKIEAEAALAAAKKMRDTLQAQVAGGASFTNAARQAGLEVKALTGIQLSSQSSELSNDVKRQLLRSVPGEILAPVADFNGSHQIVRVMARKTADDARYKEVEGQIRGSLRQNRAIAAATGYRKMIAAAAKIEPAKGFKDDK